MIHNPRSRLVVAWARMHEARLVAAVGDNVVEHAADEGREPVRAGMTQRKCHGHDRKREPAKFAELYLLEVFVDHKAQQKGAPKIQLKKLKLSLNKCLPKWKNA